jgi:four helix bundle protein
MHDHALNVFETLCRGYRFSELAFFMSRIPELLVLRKAKELCVAVNEIAASLPVSEQAVFSVQARRAALSTPSNISEGRSGSTKTYIRYLTIAMGSNAELHTQLELARELGWGDARKITGALKLSDEVGKMLNGLISALRRRLPNP